ncbi:MAG: hypothetical protein GY705_28545, partial [Bacteroidetes bacterium]|nr:hypothetical protein [Bacteroidota bacterium]
MTYGDSITQGLWEIQNTPLGARVGGYQTHLEYLFSLVGKSAQVYNWGLGGETTHEALANSRIDSSLASHGSAEYLLLMQGTNDYFSSIPPWQTANNIGKMIDKAKAYGMVPIVGNITPDQREVSKQIESRNSYIAIIASQKGVALVDMYNGLLSNWNSYVSSDNL